MIKLEVNVEVTRPLVRLLPDNWLVDVRIGAVNDLTDLIRSHFAQRAASTGSASYWGAAKRKTQATHGADASRITISQTGVRLHWRGGVVKPVPGRVSEVTGNPIKSLLIPARWSRLRGKSLKELNLPRDEVMVIPRRGKSALLAHVRKLNVKRPRRNSRAYKTQTIDVLGFLVKSAKHKADPTVMPAQQEMEAAVKASAISTICNLITR